MSRKRLLVIVVALVASVLLVMVLVRGGPARRGDDSPAAATAERGADSDAGAPSDHGSLLTEEELLECAIEGTVEDEGGAAVDGAEVTVQRARGGPPFRGRPSQRATTEGDGAFRVEVACGEHRVTATAPGLVSPRPREVEVTEVATVRLVLSRRGHTLSGVVIDRSGGTVPMAVVQALRFPGGGTYSVATDGEGRYQLLLPLATYWVEASAADYAPARRRLVVNRERTADFRLDPAGTIRGRVVRESGEAVAGAEVRGRMGRRWHGHLAMARSDAAGTFELVGLAPGEYDVEATRGRLHGRYPGHVPVNVASYTPDVVLTVRPGLSVRGRVRDEGGAGVADAVVQWFMGRGRGRSDETRSRSDGFFELTGLESGRGLVVAQHDDFVSGTEPVLLVDVDVDDVEVELTSGARVRGTVVDRTGTPVESALVSGSGSEGGGRRRMMRMMMQAGTRDITDRDGNFLLKGIGSGDVTIRAQHLEGGLATHTLDDVESGREYDVRLVMAQGASVSGTVRYVDGEPALGATVNAFNRALGPMGAAEAEVTETGTYALTGLDGLAYRLWVMRPGAEAAMPFPGADSPQRDVELEPGQTLTNIDFELARADGSIAGTVVDESGTPVADAEVGADLEAGMPGGFRFRPPTGSSTRSAADGSFVIADLVSGTYEVWAELPGFPRGSVAEVEAGATGVVIRIPPGAVLAGSVVTFEGEPVTSYRLRTFPVYESAGWSRWRGADRLSIDDAGGAFEVRGLRSGTYRLVATTPGGQVGEVAAVEAVAGERRDGLRIQVSGGASLSGTLGGHASASPVCADLFLVTDAGRKSLPCDGGRFEAEGLASGEGVLMARPDEATHIRDRFHLTLTAGDNEVALRLVEVGALAPGSATPGLAVAPVTGRFVAASAVGGAITAGDELVGIDGIALEGLGIHGVEALLRGPTGSSVSVDLKAITSGEGYTAVLTRSE